MNLRILNQGVVDVLTSALLVDDSTAMRDMVAFTLKWAGHHVVEAKDEQEALNITKPIFQSSVHRRYNTRHGRQNFGKGAAQTTRLQIYSHSPADDRKSTLI